MTRREPSRSSPASAVAWVSRITSLGLEFALPAVGGFYLDKYLHSRPIALIAGSILGFAAGMVHILRIAREGSGPG